MAASSIIFFLAPTSASPGWGSGSAGPFGPSSNLQPRKRGLRLSPRAAFHLPGVPALRSACSARPATRREYARQIYDLPSLVALRAPSKRCPRAFSRVNAASDRPSPKVTKEGRALARLATAN